MKLTLARISHPAIKMAGRIQPRLFPVQKSPLFGCGAKRKPGSFPTIVTSLSASTTYRETQR
jgi:hypothetical protein